MRDLGGSAVLSCKLASDWGMTDCTVRYESAKGLGFAEAATKISSAIRLEEKSGLTSGAPISFEAIFIPPQVRLNVRPEQEQAPRPAILRMNPADGLAYQVRTTARYGLSGYMPDRAIRFGVSGLSVIRCSVSANGSLSACETLLAEPAGFGFGEAGNVASTRAIFISPSPRWKAGDKFDLAYVFKARGSDDSEVTLFAAPAS